MMSIRNEPSGQELATMVSAAGVLAEIFVDF